MALVVPSLRHVAEDRDLLVGYVAHALVLHLLPRGLECEGGTWQLLCCVVILFLFCVDVRSLLFYCCDLCVVSFYVCVYMRTRDDHGRAVAGVLVEQVHDLWEHRFAHGPDLDVHVGQAVPRVGDHVHGRDQGERAVVRLVRAGGGVHVRGAHGLFRLTD